MKKVIKSAIVCLVVAIVLVLLGTDYYRKAEEHTLAESVEEKSADETDVESVEPTAEVVVETDAESVEPAAEVVVETDAESVEPTVEVVVETTPKPTTLPSIWEDSSGKVFFLGEHQLESALALTLQERINASEISAWHQYDAVAEGDVIWKDQNGAEITALYGMTDTDIPETLVFLRNGTNLFIYTDEETHQIIEEEQNVFEGAPDASFEEAVFCEEHKSIKGNNTINLAYLNAKLEKDNEGYGIYGKFPYNAVSKMPLVFVLVQRTIQVNGETVPALTWVVRVCNDDAIEGVVVVPPSGGPGGGGDDTLTPTTEPTLTPTTAPTPTPTTAPTQTPGFNPRPTPTEKPSQGPSFNPRPTATPGFSDPTPTVEPEFSDPGFNPKPTTDPGVTKAPEFNPRPTVVPEATKAPEFNPKPTVAPTNDDGSFNQKPEDSATKTPAFSDNETDAGFSERPQESSSNGTEFSDRPSANSEPVSDNNPPPPAFG